MIYYSEHEKGVLQEQQDGRLKKRVWTVALPCSDRHKYREPQLVQLTEARDQKITCPRCGKEHWLTWSSVGND